MNNIICKECKCNFLLNERIICNSKINYCISCFNNINDTYDKFIIITLKERIEKYNEKKLEKLLPLIGFCKDININI